MWKQCLPLTFSSFFFSFERRRKEKNKLECDFNSDEHSCSNSEFYRILVCSAWIIIFLFSHEPDYSPQAEEKGTINRVV